ncbi:MAG TPA: DUF4962 domain-containing protein [Terriglobales bacterium]|jgi:hypothetical protein|nr:DUF4962 domain-containing protein [Terriglobales bacterium]
MKSQKLLLLALPLFLLCSLAAQDAHETLGPKQNPGKGGPPPLADALASLNSKLRPELAGIHPRVYFTDSELATLRERAHGSQKELWARALASLRALQGDPPPPPAGARRAQNEVGLAIAEAAFAYKIEGGQKYLDAARKYMDAAVSYDIWGYAYHQPNVDLAAGHLLYGMSVGYDLLYHDLSEADRARYREKIARQASLLYDYYVPKSGTTYSYSQNHVFIPISGLGIAAYALYDEVPDAPRWAALSRAIFDRVLQTYSSDGYYYESFEYWVFVTPWIIHYLDAHLHATGEDLFNQPGLRQMHLYLAHSMAPGGQTVFDFGDAFEGALTRSQQGEAYPRSYPGGHFLTSYNLLYDLAAHFHDSQIQGVARWMESLGHVNAEEWWSLAWYDEKLLADSIEKLPHWHYFRDNEVVYWRTDWSTEATAIAFKCGPPEGHQTAALQPQLTDWHLELGHAHPDANSFILFAHGEYLTGDSGYAGVPLSAHHNTLLVDGRGQGNEGSGHNAWYDFPYDQLNGVRITKAKLSAKSFDLEGEAAPAYDAKMGLTRFRRRISFEREGPASVASSGWQTIIITDQIRGKQRHLYTELLHADTKFRRENGSQNLDNGKQSGAKEYEVKVSFAPARSASADVASSQARAQQAARMSVRLELPADTVIEIEPNIVMGPGLPGSTDKGDQQQRGERLAVTTSKPATSAKFRWILEF